MSCLVIEAAEDNGRLKVLSDKFKQSLIVWRETFCKPRKLCLGDLQWLAVGEFLRTSKKKNQLNPSSSEIISSKHLIILKDTSAS